MPVLVTRADLGIGPALVTALSGDGADVRAFATGTGEVARLKAAGAFVAVGDLDDEGHLDAAMTHVHTVIVPTHTWLAEVDLLDSEVDTIMTAATNAEVRRVLLVSLAGADPAASATLPAAFGRAEARVAAGPMQSLVVRTDGIVEHGLNDVVAALDCPVVLAPVTAARLVDGLVALDAARSGRDDGHALFTALGDTVTVGPGASGTAPPTSGTRTTGEPATATAADLVGRRWLAPARRDALREALCGRERPPMAGSDLWEFIGDAP